MIHINRFIDKIKFFESKNSKDFIIPLSEAKDLHSDITKLLLALHTISVTDKEVNATQPNEGVDGGDW